MVETGIQGTGTAVSGLKFEEFLEAHLEQEMLRFTTAGQRGRWQEHADWAAAARYQERV